MDNQGLYGHFTNRAFNYINITWKHMKFSKNLFISIFFKLAIKGWLLFKTSTYKPEDI